MPPLSIKTLAESVGHEIGVSPWINVDQAMIDAFATLTDDTQWIHTDSERAAHDAPTGTTIAHGLLTLSLLPAMRREVGAIPIEAHEAINYGYDRIRFLSPVPPGSRLRARVTLTEADPRGNGWLLTMRNTVEIEGSEQPALIADSLTLLR